jgi:hypothetical protein
MRTAFMALMMLACTPLSHAANGESARPEWAAENRTAKSVAHALLALSAPMGHAPLENDLIGDWVPLTTETGGFESLSFMKKFFFFIDPVSKKVNASRGGMGGPVLTDIELTHREFFHDGSSSFEIEGSLNGKRVGTAEAFLTKLGRCSFLSVSLLRCVTPYNSEGYDENETTLLVKEDVVHALAKNLGPLLKLKE